ncbi:N-acetylglutamate synthase, CG3035 family [Mycobacterium spongiae]|uniref:GNAT family N-acetyltransferase n=1 Tax=Mycobacterium spongiae TaxID=886343 RepID=A0A975JV11_9MYCO|nr:GNAT family N-acetyltransferase [Mycobacterium spongiae]QUR66171.1 GNAT family N-acetyltransferase [Mycobacterium spongiae]
MVMWPALGTRVTVRYRRPAGSVPPLTDAVGHLLAVSPTVRVRTKNGAIVEFAPGDAVALRELTDVVVRTSEIRGLERAAAAAWPGIEQAWQNGWLLRAGRGASLGANSAVPLDISADISTIPAIISWYTHRNLTPRLAVPERLLPPPAGLASEWTERILVRDLGAVESDQSIVVSARPDDVWLRAYRAGERRHLPPVPVDVLTAVIDGELAFGRDEDVPGGGVARAAVTDAPDGTRWVGLSAFSAADHRDTAGAQRRLCESLLRWGADHGASRGYMRVGEHDAAARALGESLGFRTHHRCRYFPAHQEPGLPSSHA